MASNPIKRRARQSFFLGFLIALVIMAVIVMLLFTRINSLNEENEKLKLPGTKISVYTVNRDIEEGENITEEDLEGTIMQLSRTSKSIDVANYIDPSIFSYVNEETGEVATYTSKVKIPAGTVVTLSMLQRGDINSDERLMEYNNLIVIPSQLKNGDYIDIRLRLPNGVEKVVLAKKKVEQCTSSAIWMKMKEIDIDTMNSAIIDSYLIPGTQLRATVYTDPMLQAAAETDYPVRTNVLDAIYNSPNISNSTKEMLNELWMRKTLDGAIDPDLLSARTAMNAQENTAGLLEAEKNELVGEGYEQEATDIKSARDEFVSELEGTGLVGTTVE